MIDNILQLKEVYGTILSELNETLGTEKPCGNQETFARRQLADPRLNAHKKEKRGIS
jgi:hypothetical protein